MQSLRIALVCDWFAPQLGGIESHIGDLARELRARGHAPHVITSTPGPSEVDGVPVHRLAAVRLPRWNVVADPRAIAQVRALCVRLGIELVHGHSLQSPLAHLAMYAARGLGLPSVLTQHSVLTPGATRGLRALDRRLGWAAWPTAITAVSSLAAARTRDATGRADVHVLRTGLDLAAWARRAPAPAGPPTVVTVTRLFTHKRTDDLVRAVPRVVAATDARFAIVGDGPERARLERLAARLGVAARIAWLGALPRAEVARVVERAHVFVLPNPGEAFGIAALEARALGVPVVARSQSGARDLIEHGRHGYLCPTIDGMADAIARLCSDEVTRRAMARRAHEGLDAFGWGHALERHLGLYRATLAGAPVREVA